MSEWKPIASAPKDGTAILVAFSWRGTPLESAGVHAVVWRPDRPGWYLAALNSIQLGHRGVDEDDAADATHWQALPSPPVNPKAGTTDRPDRTREEPEPLSPPTMERMR